MTCKNKNIKAKIGTMITIEQVLEVLKRTAILEILLTKTTHIHGLVTFDHLSAILHNHLQGPPFKPEFLENAVKAAFEFLRG